MTFWKIRSSSDELLNLDLIRFIASIGIVAHHSIEYFVPVASRDWLADKTMGLALFVDLFFVISGFVIAYVYHDRVGTATEYGRFLQRRVGRLVPLHILTLLLSIFVWTGFVVLGRSGNHPPSFEPRCIVETVFFLHAIMPCGNGIFFNGVSWSIGAEMAMYLAFPIFVWLAMCGRSALVILSGLVLTLVASFDIAANGSGSARSWVDLAPVFRALPSFMVGASLFHLRAPLRKIPRPGTLLASALGLMLVVMVTGFPHIAVLAVVYLVAVLAIAADLQGSVSAPARRLGPLGQLTYSMYMWHGLIILVVMNAIGDKLIHAGSGVMILLSAICYATIFAVSYFSYFAIETPARRYIDNLGSKRRIAAPAE